MLTEPEPAATPTPKKSKGKKPAEAGPKPPKRDGKGHRDPSTPIRGETAEQQPKNRGEKQGKAPQEKADAAIYDAEWFGILQVEGGSWVAAPKYKDGDTILNPDMYIGEFDKKEDAWIEAMRQSKRANPDMPDEVFRLLQHRNNLREKRYWSDLEKEYYKDFRKRIERLPESDPDRQEILDAIPSWIDDKQSETSELWDSIDDIEDAIRAHYREAEEAVPKRPSVQPEAEPIKAAQEPETASTPEEITDAWLASKGEERGFYERRQSLVSNVRRLVKRLQKNPWRKSGDLTVKDRSGQKDVASVSDNLRELKDLGHVQVAWDENGESYYALAGQELPSHLTQEPETAKEPWEMTKEEWGIAHIAATKHENRDLKVKRMGALTPKSDSSGTIERIRLEHGVEATPIRKRGVPIVGHEAVVRKALSEGKSVPPEVLAEYPDLVAPETAKETPAETPQTRKPVTAKAKGMKPEEQAKPASAKPEFHVLKTHRTGVARTVRAVAGERHVLIEQGKFGDKRWTIVEPGGYTGEITGKTPKRSPDTVLADNIRDLRKAKDVAQRIFEGTFDREADARFQQVDTKNIGVANAGIAKLIKKAPLPDSLISLLKEQSVASDGRMLLRVSDKDRAAILKGVGEFDAAAPSYSEATSNFIKAGEEALGQSKLLMQPVAYRGGDITDRTVVLKNRNGESVVIAKVLHDTVMKKFPNAAVYGALDNGAVAYGVNGELFALVMSLTQAKPDANLKALMKGAYDFTPPKPVASEKVQPAEQVQPESG
ncbi:MAG: hypothetical protein U9Q07_09275, partial [Planctomycetota bacterium]|nr:hypothetical protein [Planctomycetota bacterium]